MADVDSFPAVLAKIDHAVSHGEFGELSEICEFSELLAAEQEQDPQKVDMMYCVHVLAYLLRNDLTRMKYLFRRIPADVLERSATLKILHSAYIARCTNDLPLFFNHLHQLKDVAGALAPLANEVISRQRDLILDNVALMYSKVSIEKVRGLIAVDSAQVLALTGARQWELQDEKYLVPKKANISSVTQEGKGENGARESSLNEQLQRITSLVAFLERHHVLNKRN